MADYYSNFSVVLGLEPQQTQEAFQLYTDMKARREEAEAADDFDESTCEHSAMNFLCQAQPEGLWLWSDGESNCLDTANFLQLLLNRFDIKEPIGFEISYDCSKPRTDAYRGAAVAIWPDRQEWFSTQGWLQDQLEKGGLSRERGEL